MFILGSDQVNSGKNTKINKQSDVNFWLDWKKYETVSFIELYITLDVWKLFKIDNQLEKTVKTPLVSNSLELKRTHLGTIDLSN